MNNSVAVFGSFGDGYTQYPDNYAREIYEIFIHNRQATSQIIIHRDNNLMYYGYIQLLENSSQYIGFCILLNGVMFSRIDGLFTIFENAVADMVNKGKILQLNSRGEIISSVTNLYEERQEVERIASVIQNQTTELEHDTKKLPPVNYGISNNERKIFSVNNNIEDIINSSCQYAYTCIIKNMDKVVNLQKEFPIITAWIVVLLITICFAIYFCYS